MPNIKSAKKRVLVNAKKTEQNKMIRSAVKTEIKKIDVLLKANKLEEAKAALSAAFSVIDAACSKNIYHANNAANKKAKLAKRAAFASSSLFSLIRRSIFFISVLTAERIALFCSVFFAFTKTLFFADLMFGISYALLGYF